MIEVPRIKALVLGRQVGVKPGGIGYFILTKHVVTSAGEFAEGV